MKKILIIIFLLNFLSIFPYDVAEINQPEDGIIIKDKIELYKTEKMEKVLIKLPFLENVKITKTSPIKMLSDNQIIRLYYIKSKKAEGWVNTKYCPIILNTYKKYLLCKRLNHYIF